MAFTAKDVKELRERTGCGMMDCKKALTETDGDFDKAIEYLREKGLAAATKKAGRIAADGMVFSTVDRENKIGVVVEVNSETDFVAKNEMFREFVADVAAVVAKENPATVEELLTKAMPNGDTVEAALQEKILVIGENLKIPEGFEGEESDLSGKIIIPGLVDTHVHITGGGGEGGFQVGGQVQLAPGDGGQLPQLPVQGGGHDLGHLGLADTGRALDEQGTAQLQGNIEGSRQNVVVNIVRLIHFLFQFVQFHMYHSLCDFFRYDYIKKVTHPQDGMGDLIT